MMPNKQQKVGKTVYAVGRKFVSVEEKHGCEGCAGKPCPVNEDKALRKFRATLCTSLPDCGGVIWEEV